MAQIIVLLAQGFEEIEAVSIIDVCRRGGIEVHCVGVDSTMVCGANKITIQADCTLDTIHANDYDMVVLPGGFGGTQVLASNDKVQTLLKEFKNTDKAIGAICAAPLALHKAGVLSQNYTCYPSIEQSIRLNGYQATMNVVEEDNILTSRGPATAICFGLAIVAKLVGNDVAQSLKGGLLADHC